MACPEPETTPPSYTWDEDNMCCVAATASLVAGSYDSTIIAVRTDAACCDAGKASTDVDMATNLIMACEPVVVYECDENNENCMKKQTSPTAGSPGQTTDTSGPATDEEIC